MSPYQSMKSKLWIFVLNNFGKYVFYRKIWSLWKMLLTKFFFFLFLIQVQATNSSYHCCTGVIQKPCGDGRGNGGLPNVYFLHKPFKVKLSIDGYGGQRCPKICPHGLRMIPQLLIHCVPVKYTLNLRDFYLKMTKCEEHPVNCGCHSLTWSST